VEGQIWRGGAHAAVPNGAVVLLPPTGYTPSHEGPTLIPPRRSAWGLTDAERAALAAQPEPKSSQLQDVFPNLWTSPRRLSLVEEAHALALADDPPSGAVCCGVRAVHGGWVYTTGKAASLHNWGTCKLKEDAQLLATARMHAAWLEWHDLVLEAAGGRTDWLGGIRRPEDGMEYDLGADGDTWKPWGAPGQSTGERL
jgi:hypothetical protein